MSSEYIAELDGTANDNIDKVLLLDKYKLGIRLLCDSCYSNGGSGVLFEHL